LATWIDQLRFQINLEAHKTHGICLRAETGVKFTKEWNFVNSAPHCGGVFDICELLTAQMLGNTLVGQLTGEALCKSGYDCGICFSFELCGIEHESKDVLSINFCSCFNFAARGDQNLWVTHIAPFHCLKLNWRFSIYLSSSQLNQG
jgi:hypothetical protein